MKRITGKTREKRKSYITNVLVQHMSLQLFNTHQRGQEVVIFRQIAEILRVLKSLILPLNSRTQNVEIVGLEIWYF